MGYLLFSGGDRAQAWNAAGAVSRAALLIALAWHWRGPILAVVCWWLVEESLVVGCSVGYIIKPWPVPAGMDQCSALIGMDLGKISGAVMIGLLIYVLGFSRRTSV